MARIVRTRLANSSWPTNSALSRSASVRESGTFVSVPASSFAQAASS
jgi:hypothetical protein